MKRSFWVGVLVSLFVSLFAFADEAEAVRQQEELQARLVKAVRASDLAGVESALKDGANLFHFTFKESDERRPVPSVLWEALHDADFFVTMMRLIESRSTGAADFRDSLAISPKGTGENAMDFLHAQIAELLREKTLVENMLLQPEVADPGHRDHVPGQHDWIVKNRLRPVEASLERMAKILRAYRRALAAGNVRQGERGQTDEALTPHQPGTKPPVHDRDFERKPKLRPAR